MANLNVRHPARAMVALAGFVVLGLSPSFVDWQESPEKHKQMIAYYAIAIGLIGIGIL